MFGRNGTAETDDRVVHHAVDFTFVLLPEPLAQLRAVPKVEVQVAVAVMTENGRGEPRRFFLEFGKGFSNEAAETAARDTDVIFNVSARRPNSRGNFFAQLPERLSFIFVFGEHSVEHITGIKERLECFNQTFRHVVGVVAPRQREVKKHCPIRLCRGGRCASLSIDEVEGGFGHEFECSQRGAGEFFDRLEKFFHGFKTAERRPNCEASGRERR